MNSEIQHPNYVYSIGTRVVALVDIMSRTEGVIYPRGAVGVIVKSPVDVAHSYRVRFPDGVEELLKQDQIVILSKFKEGEIGKGAIVKRDELFNRVIFRCVIGSRAYGLEDEHSDIDYRGIFIPPADLHWSLYGVPENLECHETQEAYWELQKFLILALKANPNVLECLYSPLVEKATPLAKELLGMRDLFLSRLVYQTYNGYVLSQFKKMQADIRNHGKVKWKHVMHLIRLLISGKTALKERFIPVKVDEHREQLLAIKQGEMPWEEIEKWRRSLHQDFEAAWKTTKLPERPNYERANTFLIEARRAAILQELP